MFWGKPKPKTLILPPNPNEAQSLPASSTSKEASVKQGPIAQLKQAKQGMQSEKLLVFGVLVILSSVLAAIGGTLNLYYKKNIAERYQQYGQIIAHLISIEGKEVFHESPATRQGHFQRLGKGILNTTPDIASLQFLDAEGELIYGVRREEISKAALKDLDAVSVPIRRIEGGKLDGQVMLHLTGHRLKSLQRMTTPILTVPFVSAWMLTVLVIMVMTYIWMKQLELIVNAVQRLSQGEFGVRLDSQHFTGLQKQLAEDINEMSRRLKIYEEHNIETILFERGKLEACLQSIVDGVIVCDQSDRVALINDAAMHLLDIETRAQALGATLQAYQDDQGNTPFTEIINAFKDQVNDIPDDVDDWFMAPFGQVVQLRVDLALRVIIAPIRHAARETQSLGYVMIMHNITQELEVDRLKTSFISNVSHELRTPVTTIKSYVDTLYHHGDDLDEETKSEFMATLNTETERLKKLVNDILDFSRLDEGQVQLRKEWEEITPLISLTTQSVKVLAQQKNISLSSALESDLPNVYIHNDSIERVMLNLLSNAIKYTPENGHVKVSAGLTPDRQGIMVSVQDTGIGIKQEHLAKVFDRFYRVENKVHTVKGTGLGLHLVKITIEKHHAGRVFVESVEGQGSTFGFILPVIETVSATEV